jgi:uncharacterized membrane protein YgdD (TMEM256/DUF423 family)
MSALGPLLGFLGVALGAFGAHALKGRVDPELWRTAVLYQLVHAAAMLAAPSATRFWAPGVLVFSGTLYALALGAPRWLGAVTPVGGLLLLAGWASLLIKSRP